MNFIQQAYKGENSWLHYLGAIVLVFFGWQFLGSIPLLIVAVMHSKNMSDFHKAAENSFLGMGINSNLFLFLMIMMFAIGVVFLYIGVKFIHRRGFLTVVTSRKKMDWGRFFTGFISWGLIAVTFIILDVFISPDSYTWNFKPIPFFILLTISFLFLPIQTSFEELLFRGYFMQGVGIWFKNRWVPLILTSVIFGLMHIANPEVAKLGYISMVFYIGTGLFYGVTTLMDEGTELALGLHAVNNITAAFLVTTDWTVFQTDALFIDTSEPSVGFEMFLPVFVLYPLMLLFFSKRYKWTDWRGKLIGKIKKPLEIEQNQFS